MLRTVGPLLVSCLLMTACSGDPELTGGSADRDAAPAPAASSPAAVPDAGPTEPAPGPSGSGPAFAADTSPDEQAATGGPLGVRTVRVARQDGYDRVVFELAGRSAGQPGWTVAYTDDPRQDGSGDPVRVQGEAVLEVRLTGVGYPFDTGVEEQPPSQVPGSGTAVVREVRSGALFEGVFQAFVGTSREAPFRVFRLDGPPRVVVDVRHD